MKRTFDTGTDAILEYSAQRCNARPWAYEHYRLGFGSGPFDFGFSFPLGAEDAFLYADVEFGAYEGG